MYVTYVLTLNYTQSQLGLFEKSCVKLRNGKSQFYCFGCFHVQYLLNNCNIILEVNNYYQEKVLCKLVICMGKI